ncbi:MAG: S8 family serine peptidase [Candidatus Riflebacteria bacterium]|nr:S8 family serine peptidase [Candidatus Riflebacteria bacterium]
MTVIKNKLKDRIIELLPIFICLCASLVPNILQAHGSEIPCKPFEPVYVGPELNSSDLKAFRSPEPVAASLPNDPFLEKQWYLYNYGQPDDQGNLGVPGCDSNILESWKSYHPQKEVILAIVDSGLDLTHEDIDPSFLWTNPGETGTDADGKDKATNGKDDDGNGYIDDIHGWNFQRNTPNIQEDQYHGTHVTGMLSATSNNTIGISGSFPFLKIMPVKIFGLGNDLSSAEIAKAIHYAVDNGAKVLSNSYGTPSFSQDMKDAISYCNSKGVLFVCASGNYRKNMDVEEEKDYPSCYGLENELVVGATDNRDLSTFSNFGSMVEIVAPGDNIFSLWPKSKYRSLSGTSQACPLVAATAVMTWSQHPEWTWREVKQNLLSGADQIQGLSRYVKGGLRLNVGNSIKGKTGIRLPQNDYNTWKTMDYLLESKHPYLNGQTATFSINIENAKKFRLHFAQLAIDHYDDYLSILDRNASMTEFINGVFGESWSEPIEGNQATLILKANDYVNEYGFKIDKVQFQPEERK